VTCTLEILQKRAKLLQQIREFFNARDVLEVDTPILSQYAATDSNLDSLQTIVQPEKKTYYLQTSPEFAMKRLLAQGVGAIYQFAKVFRNGELSTKHNPEFTLLEWYRPGFDYHQLITEVEVLLTEHLNIKKTIKMTYQESFKDYCQLDPLTASVPTCHETIKKHNIQINPNAFTTRDDCLQVLMTHVIEPQLPKDNLVFIYDYPESQAMLAQLNQQGLAERFEIYYQGLELGNGFQELTDAEIQCERFQADLKKRQKNNLEIVPMDTALLEALNHMPTCSGVAIGVERLMMCLCDTTSVADVMCFVTTVA
jgi:elongation factor P--(R)-beta-lysine ligase